MRIIAGIYKGRLLKIPKNIRPTQDKVRKALFDILGDIKGLSFLELFAGSGAVGIESLSRGSNRVTFIEDNPACISIIKANIQSLKLKEEIKVYLQKAGEAVEILHKKNIKFEIIFIDPPYYRGLAKKTLQILEAYDILAPNGLIVVQHFKKECLFPELGELILFKQSVYGDTILSFYRKKG